jgi:hypothetical protein
MELQRASRAHKSDCSSSTPNTIVCGGTHWTLIVQNALRARSERWPFTLISYRVRSIIDLESRPRRSHAIGLAARLCLQARHVIARLG